MTHVYTGALHIHSNYSDGKADINTIASVAKKAGLSWVIITDHNNLKGLHDGKEGWYDDIAVMIGEEVSPENSNHYLAFDINQDIAPSDNPEVYINEVKKRGGMGFIAHPDERINRKNTFKPLRWENWDITDFGGIEIWNFLSDWVDNYDTSRVFHCYFRSNDILTGPTKELRNWWDKLNNSTHDTVPVIGGCDAHALEHIFWGIKVEVFPYLHSFKNIANCIYLDKELSRDFHEAKLQIYDALRKGKNTIINRHWDKQSNKFQFYIKNHSDKTYPGGTAKLNNSSSICIKLPKKANIRLLHNGRIVREEFNRQIVYNNLTEGKYRVEVYYKTHPWIFTNPIIAIKE